MLQCSKERHLKNGDAVYDHGFKDLILLECQFFPAWSVDLIQLQ